MEQENPPIESATLAGDDPQATQPKVDPSTSLKATAYAEEPDLDARIKDMEAKLREARADAEKKRRQKREVLQKVGQYEELYQESQQEVQQLSTERDGYKSQVSDIEGKLASANKEIQSYRAALLDQFEEADREIAAEYSLSRLPDLYNRLYGKALLQKPAPSVGAHKPAVKAASAAPSLAEAQATGDPEKINAAFDALLANHRR